jgi:hypothetical protein
MSCNNGYCNIRIGNSFVNIHQTCDMFRHFCHDINKWRLLLYIFWSGVTVIERMSKSKSMYSFSKKTTNQNTASNNYFILNGHYWSPNTQHVLKCFMIVIPTYQLWKNMYMYNWQIWMLSDLIKRYTVTDVICWCHGKNDSDWLFSSRMHTYSCSCSYVL